MTKHTYVHWPLTRSKIIQGHKGQISIFPLKCIYTNNMRWWHELVIWLDNSRCQWVYTDLSSKSLRGHFRLQIASWYHLVRWKTMHQCCLSWHRFGVKGHLGSFPVPAKIGSNGQIQLFLSIWRNNQAYRSYYDRTFDGQ